MTETEVTKECITTVIKTINNYLENDKGALDFIDFTVDNVLLLSFNGACVNCKKNNDHLKYVIIEMFEEVVSGKITEIRYV